MYGPQEMVLVVDARLGMRLLHIVVKVKTNAKAVFQYGAILSRQQTRLLSIPSKPTP